MATPEEQLAKFRMLHDGFRIHWQHPLLDLLDKEIKELEAQIPAGPECRLSEETSIC